MPTCPKCSSPFVLPFVTNTWECFDCGFQLPGEPSEDSSQNLQDNPDTSELPDAISVIEFAGAKREIKGDRVESAWEEFEAIEPDDRSSPLVAGVGCRLAAATGQWARGDEYAESIRSSSSASEKCKEAAARFYHANARRLIKAGKTEEGRRQADLACEVWEGIRDEIRDDETISGAS